MCQHIFAGWDGARRLLCASQISRSSNASERSIVLRSCPLLTRPPLHIVPPASAGRGGSVFHVRKPSKSSVEGGTSIPQSTCKSSLFNILSVLGRILSICRHVASLLRTPVLILAQVCSTVHFLLLEHPQRADLTLHALLVKVQWVKRWVQVSVCEPESLSVKAMLLSSPADAPSLLPPCRFLATTIFYFYLLLLSFVY